MITVYTKNGCPQCTAVKRWLKSKNLAFEEINIEGNVELVEQLKAEGFKGMPVVKAENFQVQGFAPNKLEQLL